MRTIAQGQRVVVKKVDSIIINAPGTVTRVQSHGRAAWVELDVRSVDGAHRFPKNDSTRGRKVLADVEDCEPETGKGAKGTRPQRRKNARIAEEPASVGVERFGKDHWSTFAYLAHCAIDGIGGRIDIRKMRCDKNRHPLHAHEGSQFGETSPTRIKGTAGPSSVDELRNHDDWDCADDLAAAGLIENEGTSMNPVMKLTPLGFDVWKQLGEHKQAGGNFHSFDPKITGEARAS